MNAPGAPSRNAPGLTARVAGAWLRTALFTGAYMYITWGARDLLWSNLNAREKTAGILLLIMLAAQFLYAVLLTEIWRIGRRSGTQ